MLDLKCLEHIDCVCPKCEQLNISVPLPLKTLGCAFCFHTSLFEAIEIYNLNGYKIRWNELIKEWQVSHPEIGTCGEYASINDALYDAYKG